MLEQSKADHIKDIIKNIMKQYEERKASKFFADTCWYVYSGE